MTGNAELNPVDQSVLVNMRNFGKKIKKYQLSYLVKRDVACSDLDLTKSLKKLSDSDLIKEHESNEYILNN